MSNYTPRTTAPSNSDLRWIKTTSGGYNQCIYGYYGAPSVLPNCTGYVHGRVMEIRGNTSDNSGLSFGNGADYYNGSTSNWIQQQTPSLGAVACWSGGAGHVAIVERIIDDNTILLSESSWGTDTMEAVYFRTVYGYRAYGWRPINDAALSFQGFLKNPWAEETPETGGLLKTFLILAAAKRRKEKEGKQNHVTEFTSIL